MSQQPFEPSSGSAPGSAGDWRDRTMPNTSVMRGDAAPDAGYGASPDYTTTPQYSTLPVPVRRPDTLAALLLLLAGISSTAGSRR
jgi:hypothetical protein